MQALEEVEVAETCWKELEDVKVITGGVNEGDLEID